MCPRLGRPLASRTHDLSSYPRTRRSGGHNAKSPPRGVPTSDGETDGQPQATRRVEERRQVTEQQRLETPEAEVREGLAKEVALDQT